MGDRRICVDVNLRVAGCHPPLQSRMTRQFFLQLPPLLCSISPCPPFSSPACIVRGHTYGRHVREGLRAVWPSSAGKRPFRQGAPINRRPDRRYLQLSHSEPRTPRSGPQQPTTMTWRLPFAPPGLLLYPRPRLTPFVAKVRHDDLCLWPGTSRDELDANGDQSTEWTNRVTIF